MACTERAVRQRAAFDAAGLFRGRRVQPPVNAAMVTTFATGHGWANYNATVATVSDDTTDYALGGQSLKVTTKNDATAATVVKTGLAINATGKNLRLWVKVENAAQANHLIVNAGDATLANYYTWQIMSAPSTDAQSIVKDGEWVSVTLGFGSAQATGTPDRSNIQQMRIRVGGVNGQVVTAHYGGIGLVSLLSAFPKGLVTITCDDSYASQYATMRPILDAKGWGATAYTIVDILGTGGYMTPAQLAALERSNGWEVAGHAYTLANHTAGLANLTAAQQDAELRNLRMWLADNGYWGLDHYAYPLGSFSAATDGVMPKYFASGRTIAAATRETARPHNPLRIRSRSVINSGRPPTSRRSSTTSRPRATCPCSRCPTRSPAWPPPDGRVRTRVPLLGVRRVMARPGRLLVLRAGGAHRRSAARQGARRTRRLLPPAVRRSARRSAHLNCHPLAGACSPSEGSPLRHGSFPLPFRA